jgi:hypothetical protein
LIVAIAALVFAAGGTGWAATGGGTSATPAKVKAPSDAKTDKQIATKVVKNLAPSLHVQSAQSATTAGTAQSATTAGTATNANALGGAPPSSYQAAGVIFHWGNVQIAKGGADVTIEQMGSFTLTGRCTSLGVAEYLLSSPNKSYVYGEDGSAVSIAANTQTVITDDEDYDEAFYAWDPTSGTTINGTPFNWPTSTTGSNCEFQGVAFKTN